MPLLRGFRHFLSEHIRFDSDPAQGHGALARHLRPDDRILPLWRAFRDLLIACVPTMARPERQQAAETAFKKPAPGGAAMSVREMIMTEIRAVAEQQKKRLAPLADALPLIESGLDSLCIAILVATLDDRLGLDPFASEHAPLPVTLGEFISLYEHEAA